MKLASLSLTAKNGLERLKKEGITPDFDDVITMHDLGKRLENPEGLPGLSVLGNPVTVMGCTLWPWSIGASRWYYNRAVPWFDDLPEIKLYAIAFSHYYSHRPEVLVDLVDAKEAKAAIQAWANVCGATRTQLAEAIGRLAAQEEASASVEEKVCPECNQVILEDDKADLPPDLDETAFFDLCSILMKAYPGTDMEYWLWSKPQALSLRFLHSHNEANQEDGQTVNSAQMKATHSFEVGIRMIRDKHLARRKREEKADVCPQN